MVACYQAGDRGPGSTSALACYCFLPSLFPFLPPSFPPSIFPTSPASLLSFYPLQKQRWKRCWFPPFFSSFITDSLLPLLPLFIDNSQGNVWVSWKSYSLQMSLPVILCHMTPVEIGVQLHVGWLMRNHLCSSKNVYILVNWDTPQVPRFSFMYDVNKTHWTFYFLIASFKYLCVLYQAY